MSNHTPGPWHYDGSEVYCIADGVEIHVADAPQLLAAIRAAEGEEGACPFHTTN